VEGNQDKRDTLGTGKFDRKHYRLIMVMGCVFKFGIFRTCGLQKKRKAIDSDKFDVYAFHQSTTVKLKELIDVSDALKTYEFHNDDPRATTCWRQSRKFSV
jgi:hypothetical protein